MMLSAVLQDLSRRLGAEPPLKEGAPLGAFYRVSDLTFYESLPQLVEAGMGVPIISIEGHRGVYIVARLVRYQMNLPLYIESENPEAFTKSLNERIVKARGIHDLR